MSGYEITGADGNTLKIPDGEYFVNSKARARRMCLDGLSREARQVYSCLDLATMGFSQELAVTMLNGKQRDLTTTDIAKQTELDDGHVRRALDELDCAGLAERRATDGGTLHKGNVQICSWAVPRATKNPRKRPRAAGIPDWFPETWEHLQPLIKRRRIQLPQDFGAARGLFLADGEAAARALEKAEKAAIEFLERVCAAAPLNTKEERNERTEQELASEPRGPIPTLELFAHLDNIARNNRPILGPPNDQTVANFWTVSREFKADCTVPDVGQWVYQIVKDKRNAGLTSWGGVFTEFRKNCEKTKTAGGEA